jgi:hypothetical protein
LGLPVFRRLVRADLAQMSRHLILPLGPDQTLPLCAWICHERGGAAGADGLQAVACSAVLSPEHTVIGAAVQQGRPARASDRGRCAGARAHGVPHLPGLGDAERRGASRPAT